MVAAEKTRCAGGCRCKSNADGATDYPAQRRIDQRFADLDAAEKVAVSRTDVGEPLSQRVDRVVLHPVLGPILFLAVMWAVFFITTTVAGPLQDDLEAFITGPVSDAVRSLLPDHWLLSGLLVDGLIGGVGMVLTFAPLLALMFLCLAVLEDSGYMRARLWLLTELCAPLAYQARPLSPSWWAMAVMSRRFRRRACLATSAIASSPASLFLSLPVRPVSSCS